MFEQDSQKTVRDSFLGEIETEIVGTQCPKARIAPGGQVNLERGSNRVNDRRAIRVENGQLELVGYLPNKMASWLVPLIDSGQIHLDGYVPKVSVETGQESSCGCPVRLMVFQCEKGRHFLEEREPRNELDALHQTVRQAYDNAQKYKDPELVLGLAKGLRPLERQKLLPETRLLLALLPRMAHELRISQTMLTIARFRALLSTLTIGQPTHHHNLTLFPLLWPETCEASYRLLCTAIEAGDAIVEEANESDRVSSLDVKNQYKCPLLIPQGEILIGAKQNRVINVTVLVAAGVKFVSPVTCVKAGRRRYQSPHFAPKFYAPPSLRRKNMKAVHRNRLESGIALSDQNEVWDEVQKCLDGVETRSETSSLIGAFVSNEDKLKEHRRHLVLPDGTAGVLVGRHNQIIGMDLFDSPATLKTLWGRLSDAYFCDALRTPGTAPPTPVGHARRFIEQISGAARPRVPALALGDELEITGHDFVGTALLYEGVLCHLAAFSDGE